MNSSRIAAALNVITVLMAAIGYAGMAVLAWAHLDHTCATVYIERFTFGAGTALMFSGAAVAVHGLRRWALRTIPLCGHLLLLAAAPAVLTASFMVLAFSAVLLFNDRMH